MCQCAHACKVYVYMHIHNIIIMCIHVRVYSYMLLSTHMDTCTYAVSDTNTDTIHNILINIQ